MGIHSRLAFSCCIFMVLLPGMVLAQGSLTPREPLESSPVVTYPEYEYRLVVKFTDSMKARVRQDGSLESRAGAGLADVDALTRQYELTFRKLIDLDEGQLTGLEERAAARSGKAQPDLAGMMIVDVPDADTALLEKVAGELDVLPEIEYATLEPLMVPPPWDIAPVTPNLVSNQGYRGPDPGIDIDYAWTQGGNGGGVRFSDCEYGWNADHEDLNDLNLHLEAGQTIHPNVFANGWDRHGTAVIGETSAAFNAYGCSGMAPGATIFTYPEYTVEGGGRRVACITSAINDSDAGDVVLLEMQMPGPNGGETYVPAEYDLSVWTVVKLGTDAGIIVVGAAGNGGENLDSADYQSYRDRGDSGAIIVGAGTSNVQHDKLGFSSYGSRVNVQGWGQNVFTLGYGYYAEYGGDINQRYTATFGGTSSASPIVASACLAVQSVAIASFGTVMPPDLLRVHLINTGIPQGAGGHIGPLPNLRAAIDGLESMVAAVWVDFAYSGVQEGTFTHPFNTRAAGVTAAPVGGWVQVKLGLTPETLTIDKQVHVTSFGGGALIGD
jgi:hypothetical protein